MREIMLALVCGSYLLSGCAHSDGGSAYQRQMQEIEIAYKTGQITRDEYLRRRQEAANSQPRRAATMKGMLSTSPR